MHPVDAPTFLVKITPIVMLVVILVCGAVGSASPTLTRGTGVAPMLVGVASLRENSFPYALDRQKQGQPQRSIQQQTMLQHQQIPQKGQQEPINQQSKAKHVQKEQQEKHQSQLVLQEKQHNQLQQQVQQQRRLLTDDILAPQHFNCKEDDFQQLTYHGLQCHKSNTWPKAPCPIPNICVPSCSRCLNWMRGTWRLPLSHQNGSNPDGSLTNMQPSLNSLALEPKSSTQYCDSTIWSAGSWSPLNPADALDRAWYPSTRYTQCNQRALLPPSAVYQCLKGKRVMLFGDSMIRPLLGRLVAYLRGKPLYYDHRVHYQIYFMANGSHDAFVEAAFLPSLQAAAAEGDRQSSGEPAVDLLANASVPESGWDRETTMEFQFYWAPDFKNRYVGKDKPLESYPLHEYFGVMDGADIVIAGPMYHSNGTYEEFREALLSYFRLLYTSSGKRIPFFFWVASITKSDQRPGFYRKRNNVMRLFVKRLNDWAKRGETTVPVRSYYVDAERMSTSAKMPRVDKHHYHCSTKALATTYAITGSLIGNKTHLDCRDPFNLNLIHSILKVACNY